jgi:hypothetical protein
VSDLAWVTLSTLKISLRSSDLNLCLLLHQYYSVKTHLLPTFGIVKVAIPQPLRIFRTVYMQWLLRRIIIS